MKTIIGVLFYLLVIGSQNTFVQTPDWQWAVQSSGGISGNAQTGGICVDPHGNVYVLVFFDSTIFIGDSIFHADSIPFPTAVWEIVLVKYNAEGKILWTKHPQGAT